MRSSVAIREAVTQFVDPPQLMSVRGHHVLADMLNKNSVVVDLGAHFGQFSSQINVRFGCTCYAVEPNPSLFSKIPQTDHIRAFNCAIAGATGPAQFDVTDNRECSHLCIEGQTSEGTAISVQAMTFGDFVNSNGLSQVDLLKIDIEGAEFDLFSSLSDDLLRGIGQITVEFHDIVREVTHDVAVARVKARLARLGFACIVFSRTNNGDVLFVNREVYQGSRFQWFYLENMARYTHGLARLADRCLAPITEAA
jgi:FkbM family methyltransferase